MNWNIPMLLDGGLVVPTRSGLRGGCVSLAPSFLYEVGPCTIVVDVADG